MNNREKQQQLQIRKQTSSKPDPRVITPTRPVTRSSTMINDEVLPGIESVPVSYNDLSDKPTIPDELSDLLEDATHRTVTDVEKDHWNGKTDNEFAIVMAIVLGP
jgi:hypothetical protein